MHIFKSLQKQKGLQKQKRSYATPYLYLYLYPHLLCSDGFNSHQPDPIYPSSYNASASASASSSSSISASISGWPNGNRFHSQPCHSHSHSSHPTQLLNHDQNQNQYSQNQNQSQSQSHSHSNSSSADASLLTEALGRIFRRSSDTQTRINSKNSPVRTGTVRRICAVYVNCLNYDTICETVHFPYVISLKDHFTCLFKN